MYLVAVNLDDTDETVAVAATAGQPIRIGRRPEQFEEEPVDLLRIPWSDRLVSRNHCEATLVGGSFELLRLPALTGRSTPNALYTNARIGQREVVEEPARLSVGESVVIGAKGETALFALASPEDLPVALERYRTSLEEVEAEAFENAEEPVQEYDELAQLDEYSLRLQLKLLQKDLPEQVLTGWNESTELFNRASVFLENALPGQKGVSSAFVALEAIEGGTGFEVLNHDPSARADFRPSRTLLNKINPSSPDPTRVRVWSLKEHRRVFEAESLGDRVAWVVIIPVSLLDENAAIFRDEAGRPVFLYVQTRQASEAAAASFVPFLRLIASLVASLLSARAEQRLQDQMAAYFSPNLRRFLHDRDQSVLEPAMVDCTVMFADRRGHSRMLELAKSDEEILERLDENQRVVGLITEEIFRSNGVVTDFAGDGALGLWGWPNFGEVDEEHPVEAVTAAEAIIEKLADRVIFEEEQARRMSAVRIGISTGRIAVGRTGPRQQLHISVFGSVANLGARLERIAKEFRIPVLVSAETQLRVPPSGERRFRKLCLIRPAGFEESYPIYELVLPKSVGGSGIGKRDASRYEKALALFMQREWDGAIDLLDTLPEDDPPSLWLRRNALALRREPPGPGWGGEIQSLSK